MPDSQIILLLNQPSGIDLYIYKYIYIYIVNKPLWAAGISEDNKRSLRATDSLFSIVALEVELLMPNAPIHFERS